MKVYAIYHFYRGGFISRIDLYASQAIARAWIDKHEKIIKSDDEYFEGTWLELRELFVDMTEADDEEPSHIHPNPKD